MPGRHPARGPEKRIGNAERERAQARLGEHMQAGRIDPFEYSERCLRVGRARTEAELQVVFDDLPAPEAEPETVTERLRTMLRRIGPIPVAIAVVILLGFVGSGTSTWVSFLVIVFVIGVGTLLHRTAEPPDPGPGTGRLDRLDGIHDTPDWYDEPDPR